MGETKMTQEELFVGCKNFRNILEQVKHEKDCQFPLKGFPRACCGIVSRSLAIYLFEAGVSTAAVYGQSGSKSHAWVEVDDYVLDLTADQFEEIEDTVIVKKKVIIYLEKNI